MPAPRELALVYDHQTLRSIGTSVERKYTITTHFACGRIFHKFLQRAHIAYFPPHKLAFSTAMLIILIFFVFLFESIFSL